MSLIRNLCVTYEYSKAVKHTETFARSHFIFFLDNIIIGTTPNQRTRTAIETPFSVLCFSFARILSYLFVHFIYSEKLMIRSDRSH